LSTVISAIRVTVKTYAADRLRNLQESVIRSITRYAFDKGAILLAQGFRRGSASTRRAVTLLYLPIRN
jgi:hypothetical protein